MKGRQANIITLPLEERFLLQKTETCICEGMLDVVIVYSMLV